MFGNSSSADFFNVKSLVETILSYKGDARETHLPHADVLHGHPRAI
jgi:hypothetical protein